MHEADPSLVENYNISQLLDDNNKIFAENGIIPLSKIPQAMIVGLNPKAEIDNLHRLAFQVGLKLIPYFVAEKKYSAIWQSYLLIKKIGDLKDEQDKIIQLLNHILKEAINIQASDIHIEPYRTHCRIRYRYDGMLHEFYFLTIQIYERMNTRLKILCDLDISQKRKPQDGRFLFENTINIRINTCLTLHGEKIVLRILNKTTMMKASLASLGFLANQLDTFVNLLKRPNGLILITGPTGSGKTTTLYTAIQYLNITERNICTIEDPIEIELYGVNQSSVDIKAGNVFATLLKTMLRQDPDVIMLGEIRDAETAKIAIKAANTGHLVLSTLHTSNALETILRLQTLSLNNYEIFSSINMLIAERLVRALCDCKIEDIEHTYGNLTTSQKIFKANGCDKCNSGYAGRIALFEVITITEVLKILLEQQKPASMLVSEIQNNKELLLWEVGLLKALQGLTSIAELSRVLGPMPKTINTKLIEEYFTNLQCH